ncbi:uncharacterized protein LOC115817940 [Chanos chanos]|uniref:Uncharacterized protein LOC115817940 n=1 Tax=Chanos chanos TaxID=29144 RepID=A0A6J2W0Y1_CHACN|nr:uncharacterized protein LOC115817940 [Chanos chanos]
MKGADMTCKLLGQNPSDDCIEDVAKNTKHKVDPKRQRSAPPSHGEAELTPQDLCSSADPSREKVHRKRLANCGTGTRDRRKRQKEALSTETRQETTEQRNIALKNVGTRGVKPKEVIGEDTTKDISALISGTLEENPASAPTFKKRRAICTSPRTQGLETTHTASNTSGPVDLLETSSEGQRRRGGGQRRQQSVHRTPLMFCTGDNLSQEKQHDGSSDNNNSIPTERAAGTLSPCLAEQTPADNQFRMSVSAKSHRARQHQTSEQVRELHAVQMNVTVLQTGSISGEPHDETAFKGHSNQVGNGNTASELKCSTKTQQHDRADRAAHSMTGQDSLETLPPGNTVEGLKEEQRMSLPVRPNTAEEQRASRGQGGSRSPLWMNTDPVRGSVRPREKRKADASKEEDNYTNRVFKAMPRLEEQSCVREDSIRREMLNEDSEEQVSRVEHKDGKDKMRSRRGTKKGDRQRRRCRSHFGSGSKVEETRGQTEEETQVVLSDSRSERLTRSFSCPEITSLLDPENTSDTSPMPVPALHDRTPPSLPKVSSLISTTPHSHVKSKRARRHTVCSLEVEREIAPLCLRKEVYPASRTVVYGKPPFCPSYLHSPSTSLTALASCFLSSPLAFLSRRSDQRSNRASAAGDHCCGVFSSSLSGLVNTTSVSTSHAPFSSSPTTCHPKNVSTSSVSLMPDQCSSSLSLLSDLSQSPVEESRRTQQHDCKDKAEESRLTLHPRALTDEKALSDSEIKTDTKQRGKVSSIRIRKTLPKPQNNLTPMGLPKAIRVKKKVFSLEEIYTNKNFTQPPEGRLETIFEVPVDRRDGSQSLIGPKRIKRFVVFPELGVARKPKRPLIGGTAGVGGQRKVGVNLAGGRTRQGAWVTSRDEVPLMSVDLDSLLCSKLAILDSLVASDK